MRTSVQEFNISFKTAAALIAVCVLLSIFIPAIEAKAVYPPISIVKTVNKQFPSLGEEIVYTLFYTNNTSKEFTNVIIKDPFTNTNQQNLTFISASPAPTSGNDTWAIGTLGPNQSGQITIRAKVSESIPGWSSEIKNRATIQSDQTYLRRSNNASVFIVIDSPSNKTTTSGTISEKLIVDKLARNVTKGSTYSYYSSWRNTVYAEPGDEIEFLIKIKASRDSEIDSVRVSDDLPPKLTYVSDSTTVDGQYESDGIISKHIYIGDVYPHLYREIKFRVKIYPASRFNFYPIDLVNVVYAWGSDGKKIEDTVKIMVREPTDSGTSSNTGSGTSYSQGSLLSGPGMIQGQRYLIDRYARGTQEQTTEDTEEESETTEEEETEEEGEVLGATDVEVGANLVSLFILIILSCFIAFMVYCHIRENKLPKPLAKFYSKLKLFSTLTTEKIKKDYW